MTLAPRKSSTDVILLSLFTYYDQYHRLAPRERFDSDARGLYVQARAYAVPNDVSNFSVQESYDYHIESEGLYHGEHIINQDIGATHEQTIKQVLYAMSEPKQQLAHIAFIHDEITQERYGPAFLSLISTGTELSAHKLFLMDASLSAAIRQQPADDQNPGLYASILASLNLSKALNIDYRVLMEQRNYYAGMFKGFLERELKAEEHC